MKEHNKKIGILGLILLAINLFIFIVFRETNISFWLNIIISFYLISFLFRKKEKS